MRREESMFPTEPPPAPALQCPVNHTQFTVAPRRFTFSGAFHPRVFILRGSINTAHMDRNQIIANFTDMMRQFLDAMAVMYPSCPKVQLYRAAANMIEGDACETGIKEYHEAMAPLYARCARNDATLLDERIEFLDNLDMYSKWSDMCEDTRSTVWDYINRINKLSAALYTEEVMPDVVMRVSREVSANLLAKIENNEMGIADLNVNDVMGHIEDMLTPEDRDALSEFSNSMSSTGLDPNTMASMVQGMLPEASAVPDLTQLMSVISSAVEGGGNVDMMQLAGSMLPK